MNIVRQGEIGTGLSSRMFKVGGGRTSMSKSVNVERAAI